jgi:hypothetical protein
MRYSQHTTLPLSPGLNDNPCGEYSFMSGRKYDDPEGGVLISPITAGIVVAT